MANKNMLLKMLLVHRHLAILRKQKEIEMEKYLNKSTCGDSYKLIKGLPDKSVDCVYTDIPYLYAQGGCSGSEMALGMRKVYKDGIEKQGLSNGIDYSIFNDFIRVMKNINCFIWCSKDQIYPILDWFAKNTHSTYNILTWNKTDPSPMCNGNWLPDIEYCLYFNRKSKLNDGYELKSKFFVSKKTRNEKEEFHHLTIKPLALVKRHLLHTTQPNDIVLDCFMGSGTTAVACQEIGRQYIGFEISQKWCDIANNRLNKIDANGQISLFLK